MLNKKIKSLKLMLLGLVALVSSNAFGADVKVVTDGTLAGGYTMTTKEYTPSPYELTYTIKNLVFDGTVAADKVKKAEVIVSAGSAFSASTATIAPVNTIEWEVNWNDGSADHKVVVEFNVTDIAANAFKGKSAVTTVTLPANVVNIGESAFEGTKPTSVTISANATIGNNAFKNTNLSSLTIGDKATIGESAFEGTKLTSVALGKFATIGENAFKDCAELASVTFTQPGAASVSVPQQTIGAGAFSGTIISQLDLGNTNLKVVEKLFEEYNADLTKVVFPATLEEIKESAFEKCVKLATVDFTTNDCKNLKIIGSAAFGTTPKLTAIDFTKCVALVYFTNDGLAKGTNTYTTPFISTSGTNSALTTVTLPKKGDASKTQDIGTALAKLTKLTTINNLDAITLVAASAFDGDAALTEITLPKTVTDIAADAFKGAGFTKVTITCSETDGKPTIAATGNESALKTVIFSGEFKGDIATNGFTGLTKIQFGAFNGAIVAGGITLADEEATVIFGEMKKDFAAAYPITGSTTAVANLTLGTISADLSKTIVSNKVGTASVGSVASGKSFNFDVIGTATTLTFTGNVVGTLAEPTSANSTLETLNFGSVKLYVDMIKGWTNLTGLKTINWNPASVDKLKPFAGNAFAALPAASLEACTITFVTTTEVALLYGTDFATTQYINNVKISAAAVVVDPETKTIAVAAPEGFKYFYGKMYEAAAYTVPAKVGTVENMVYTAYVDKDAENVSTIYMDPLRVIDGKYYIPASTAVIVKSTSSEEVTITKEGAKSSLHYDNTSNIINDIKYEGSKKVGQEYFDANPGKTIYAMGKTSKYGLKWQPFGSDVVMPAGTFYVLTETPVGEAAAPELNIVWLDGSEENYTAIKSVNVQKQNDGAIYNLAGQKVGAEYKGVVIKNGKKYVQK